MGWNTHEVTNQVPDLGNYNLFAIDKVLQEAVIREQAEADLPVLYGYGAQLGQAEIIALAATIDHCRPEFQPYDRQGRRIDRVQYPPGWHEFLKLGVSQGLHTGQSVTRAAAFIMHGQVEAGTLCPLTMTAAAVSILREEPWFAGLGNRLTSRTYDARDIPMLEKSGMLIGMGLTEKQGGSDLRQITTWAQPAEEGDSWYRLTGHKWFFSVPTADAHLVLALLDGVHSCFYVPRRLPDGSLNSVRIMQLKDKLGNRSNASAEVEFENARALLVGEPGRGIAILAEMAGRTRLDCVLGSTALMRAALVMALHHARHRAAFGRLLVQHDLMGVVLADLALEVEAATTLAIRLAGAASASNGGPLDAALARILTPAAKFWVCKRAISLVGEAMEVLGGNGYVETGLMPRLYREAPVNSIWEGSGNIMCLDVLRAIQRHPQMAEALWNWLASHVSGDARLASHLQRLQAHLARPAQEQQAVARHLSATLVLLVQAALLRAHAPQAVADAFIETRLADGHGGGQVFGAFGVSADFERVIERAWGTAA